MSALLNIVWKLWPTRLRHQLIIGVAMVHLLLMTFFVMDMVGRQRTFLKQQSLEEIESMAKVLAVNSTSWVLAADVVGLEEIVQSMQQYPGLRYAMVVSTDGKVLAHTDRSRIGMYLSDEKSRSLLEVKKSMHVLHAGPSLVDVAAPIQTDTGRTIGWARIGQGQEQITKGLRVASINGLLYTLMAILIGSVFAFLIGLRLTADLNKLLFVSNQIQKFKRHDLRMGRSRTEEVARLGEGLNEMLDALTSGEEALRKSSEEIQDLYNNAPCGYHSVNAEGVFVRVSDTELSWLGYTREEVIGKMKFVDLLTRQSKEHFARYFSQFKERGWVRDLEFELIRKDGTILPVLLSATAIKSPSGEFLMSRSVLTDMTERKRVEEKIAALAAIVESSDDAIMRKTLDGIITSWNKGAEETYGYTEQEALGQPISLLLPVGTKDDVPDILERLKAGEHIEHYETKRRRKDGQIIDVTLSLSPIHNAEGEIIAVSTIARDITQRINAQRALQESEEMYRSLVTTMAEGVMFQNAEAKITSVNPAVEQILGRTAEELINSSPGEQPWRVVGEDGKDCPVEDFPSYVTLRTGQPQVNGVLGIYRTDGKLVWICGNCRPLILPGETKPYAVVSTFHDITESKRAEEALRRAKDAADAANKTKDQFLAVLSHELRTPLTPVLATVSAKLAQEELPEDVRSDMDLIRRNIEMEAKLIDDLLDVTKISRGKIELHPEVVDAHAIIRTVLEICQQEIAAKHMAVFLEMQAEDHYVWADPVRLRQVFWNLLKNAVEFTPVEGRISLRSANADGRIKIEIEDSGIGIRPELLPKIFNAFERGNQPTARRFGGLGLGLSIAKRIVEMHGGVITAYSAGEGKGATFTVDVPITAAVFFEQKAAPPVVEPEAEGIRKILLVEDHPDTLRSIAKLLKKWGYTVVTAENVKSAIEAAEKEQFDLLISDLGLPDGSGLEIMKKVKDFYAIRGIALSGFGTEEDIRRSREAGFDMHMTKPVTFQNLRKAILSMAAVPA